MTERDIRKKQAVVQRRDGGKMQYINSCDGALSVWLPLRPCRGTLESRVTRTWADLFGYGGMLRVSGIFDSGRFAT